MPVRSPSAILREEPNCSVIFQIILDLAPQARFELATLRLTAEMIENLSALSGVAYEQLGAIFPSLVAPTPAPTRLQNRGVLPLWQPC